MPGIIAFFAGLAAVAGAALFHSAYTLQPMVDLAFKLIPLRLTFIAIAVIPPLLIGAAVMALVGYVADQMYEGRI